MHTLPNNPHWVFGSVILDSMNTIFYNQMLFLIEPSPKISHPQRFLYIPSEVFQ